MIPLVFEKVKMFICGSIGATKGLRMSSNHSFFVHPNRDVFIIQSYIEPIFELKPWLELTNFNLEVTISALLQIFFLEKVIILVKKWGVFNFVYKSLCATSITRFSVVCLAESLGELPPFWETNPHRLCYYLFLECFDLPWTSSSWVIL